MPCPPPMHMVTSAYLPPVRRSSYSALTVRMAPVAPIGWPSAMPLPFGLTRSAGGPRSDAHQPRLAPGVRVGHEPAQRLVPVPPRVVLVGQDDRGRGVVDPGSVARGDGAVLGEGGLEPGQVIGGQAGPDVLVGVDHGDGALAAWHLD